MPFTTINQNIAFDHGPVAGSKAAVHFPATINPDEPFVLCIFMHGKTVAGVPFDRHIDAAVAQIKASSTNTLLVAPRFGDAVPDGRFVGSTGFSEFVAELRTVLAAVLTQSGMNQLDAERIATYAATRAPIVLVAFSGAYKPLNAILKGLLEIDAEDDLAKATRCADRVIAIALLDSIYGPISSSGPLEWQKARGARTALLSIYGRTTGDNARASNLALIAELRKLGPVLTPQSWDALPALPAGGVAFFEVPTSHLDIPSNGPPKQPIAAFLTLLGDRLSSFATS